ncbi:L-ascorbate metabolism protein UlaG, beta-lactamase superfamily [Nonomuraea solani]|uniref:L-ascorbate metabolism protein UlaG, beta-lactamase superfamily n=1 Tax=Nonomuraea solani TaxID=1144553 RepID=A0A1H5ZEG4_9ACTN|nr:MBL fold metallo-hydrolase [Nonomuraea solani]SEG34893.1 L-ascorbate metabolism protein UlaG, beta-lactamase superfamily [Nonomuraea solani]
MNGSLQFIGNATTLIRYNGFTLLTDPNFLHKGQRAYLGYGMTSRRLKDPAVEFEDLPTLDAVVLSHMHGDHWDRVAQRHLDKDVPVITTTAAAGRLRRRGFHGGVGLREWHQHELRGPGGTVKITALPGKHAPGVAEALMPPVIGTMLEFCNQDERVELRLHISGDTLLDRRLDSIPRRFPDIDLAIVHLGGTRLFGTLLTMDGEQGAAWVDLINPHTVVPVHFDDYEVFSSPLDDFRHHIEQAGLADRVVYLERGEIRELAPHHLIRR